SNHRFWRCYPRGPTRYAVSATHFLREVGCQRGRNCSGRGSWEASPPAPLIVTGNFRLPPMNRDRSAGALCQRAASASAGEARGVRRLPPPGGRETRDGAGDASIGLSIIAAIPDSHRFWRCYPRGPTRYAVSARHFLRENGVSGAETAPVAVPGRQTDFR